VPAIRCSSISLACAALLLAAAGPANAALKKFDLLVRSVVNSGTGAIPNPNIAHPVGNAVEFSIGVIDQDAGPNPVLRRFVRATDSTITTPVPALTTNIFTSNNFREGPSVLAQIHRQPVPSFTGTGSSASGSTIRWGIVTGWTITGSFWCNSNPAVICTLANGMDLATTEPRFNSNAYDLGTWSFHGTGFVGSFNVIYSYFSSNFGNQQIWARGALRPDGTVPALPIAGAALVGGSLAAGAAVALRRRRK
jgi:hypothetical protein